MSSTDYGKSDTPSPEAIRIVDEWLHGLADGDVVLIYKIGQALSARLGEIEIAQALAHLSAEGKLHRVYKVRLPNHQILSRVYRSLREIPNEIKAPLNETYSADDVEVVAAYEIAEHGR